MRLQITRPGSGRQLSEQLIDEAAVTFELALRFVPPHERPAWIARSRQELAEILRRSRD